MYPAQDTIPQSRERFEYSNINTEFSMGICNSIDKELTSLFPNQDIEYSGERTEGSISCQSPRDKPVASLATSTQLPGPPGEFLSSGPTDDPRKRRRRRRSLESYEIKAKRLQRYFNYEYRDLLNIEIQQISSNAHQDDLQILRESQIGSSVWTVEEKALFFAALDTLGKDNVGELSSRIGTKSALEVQDYLLALQSEAYARKHSSAICTIAEIPSAAEISAECCVVLERAADALSARQECDEIKIEQGKWDDLWLISKNICREFGRRKNSFIDLKSMDEFKPVANLFNLKNWLQLSECIFMNSAECEDGNWVNLAEQGETPAVRATAFEDFYSLAISITKRLVSATIFCTLSRQRAMGTSSSKHSGINPEDVHAAVRTLGLKGNSSSFWIGCARRCKLQVVDDVKWEDTEIERGKSVNSDINLSAFDFVMTYDEVERILLSYAPQHQKYHHHDTQIADQDIVYLDEITKLALNSHSDQDSSESGLTSSEDESIESDLKALKRGQHKLEMTLGKQQKIEENQNVSVEATDKQFSQAEEKRCWNMMKLEPPSEINDENTSHQRLSSPITQSLNEDINDWRDHLDYYSEWETLDAQVRSESFASFRSKALELIIQEKTPDFSVSEDERSNQATSSDEGRYLPDEEFFRSNYENEQTSDDVRHDTFSSQTTSSDETIAQLRGMAANFQPSSDEEDCED